MCRQVEGLSVCFRSYLLLLQDFLRMFHVEHLVFMHSAGVRTPVAIRRMLWRVGVRVWC